MTGTSHFLTGALVTGMVVGEVSGTHELVWLAPFAMIGGISSLFPDLDATRSVIKYFKVQTPWRSLQPFRFIARLIHAGFGHRGAWHSLLALIILFFLVSPVWALGYYKIFIAIILGYSTHLITDAMTKTGIPLLYPRQQRISIFPRELRITTGGFFEYLIVSIIGVLSLLWYIY